jgi:hypothetical protein
MPTVPIHIMMGYGTSPIADDRYASEGGHRAERRPCPLLCAKIQDIWMTAQTSALALADAPTLASAVQRQDDSVHANPWSSG